MIVAYAQGGGLGHLTRVRAALHTLGVEGKEPVAIVSLSRYATDRRVTGDALLLTPPARLDPSALRHWLAGALADLRPDELLVDAFPAGLMGELTGDVVPAGTRLTHLARLLRWPSYAPLLGARANGEPRGATARVPHYHQTWLTEPVSPAHLAFLRSISAEVTPLALRDPFEDTPPPAIPAGAWLIVHADPVDEVYDLIAYARETSRAEGAGDPPFVLVSPTRPPDLPAGVEHVDAYPAWPLFPAAARVVTAAGCNAVRQLSPMRDRHLIVPFPRRFDDQFARARAARTQPGYPDVHG